MTAKRGCDFVVVEDHGAWGTGRRCGKRRAPGKRLCAEHAAAEAKS
jgi:hypothetical protein